MSEPLRTHTERTRDQRRIEALEAELARARQQIVEWRCSYLSVMDALAEVTWHSRGVVWQHVLWAITGAMAAVVAMRWLA